MLNGSHSTWQSQEGLDDLLCNTGKLELPPNSLMTDRSLEMQRDPFCENLLL